MLMDTDGLELKHPSTPDYRVQEILQRDFASMVAFLIRDIALAQIQVDRETAERTQAWHGKVACLPWSEDA
jgi:hypothetical protein